MNLILAEMSHQGGPNYPLLITKEVFRVEKVPPEELPEPIGPFDWPFTSALNNQKSHTGPYGETMPVESSQTDYEQIVKHSGFLTRIPKFQWVQQQAQAVQ